MNITKGQYVRHQALPSFFEMAIEQSRKWVEGGNNIRKRQRRTEHGGKTAEIII